MYDKNMKQSYHLKLLRTALQVQMANIGQQVKLGHAYPLIHAYFRFSHK